MKKLIIAVCVLTLVGCAKDATQVDPVITGQMFSAPNGTELSLMGTWYLQQQVLATPTNHTTYTGYSNQFNITFRYGKHDTTIKNQDLYCKNFRGSWMPNMFLSPNSLPGDYGGPNMEYKDTIYNSVEQKFDTIWTKTDSLHRSDYWYCDGGSYFLVVGSSQSIFTLVSGVLTVSWYNNQDTLTSTLHQ